MRKQQEINRAAAILRKKGDRISVSQAEVLEQKRTETQLFKEFVLSVGEERKDDRFFYALRDAARYAAGALELEDLIPDASEYLVSDKDFCHEIKTISVREFKAMERKVNLLEKLVNELLQASRVHAENKQVPDVDKVDFINQSEAARYVGCRKETLRGWSMRGFITAYSMNGVVHYSKSELDTSPAVRHYCTVKQCKEEVQP
jgi:hypothetical protein